MRHAHYGLMAAQFPLSASYFLFFRRRLSELERRAVRQKLLELAAENEDVRFCDQAALAGALMLDQWEQTRKLKTES